MPVVQHDSEPTHIGFSRVYSEVVQTGTERQPLSAVLETGELTLPGQVEHAALPVEFLYFPATHAAQVPPFGPVKPGLHVQAVTTVLELGEVELPGHFEHADAPTATEYVPAAQSEHT